MPSFRKGHSADTRLRSQVRRWFDANTKSFFTLSERDRQVLNSTGNPQKSAVPDRRTPIEFFKENPPALGKDADEKKV